MIPHSGTTGRPWRPGTPRTSSHGASSRTAPRASASSCYAACAQVPLTSVASPMRRLGEVAIEILFDRYDRGGQTEPREVLLPPELVIRASCP